MCTLAACGDDIDDTLRQGGDTTVDDRSADAFHHPATNLPDAARARFQNGRSTFDFQWDVPKLGPLFNNIACVACHGGNGRGLSQIGGMALASQGLVRISLTEGTGGDPGGPVPVPGYGTQLQDHATVGLAEVHITLEWIERQESFADGELITLRDPRLTIRPSDGTMFASNARFSYRVAPAMIGLGLLEAIPESALMAAADPDDTDGDGISGRVNMVWDPEQQATVVGRFGWKANTSTLPVQAAAAFVSDIGASNILFPEIDGERDITEIQLDDTTFFAQTIAVPAAAPRDDAARHGRDLFDDFGCASCHTPTQITGPHPVAAVENQRIHPYTDLLVHDMGDGLTDARTDFVASGVEWRTPALWGIGLTKPINPMATFLHDGRATTLEEAILWHGGEAAAAREHFRSAARSDREALLAFLQTL